jgi:NitT/TauT family transport system permease protein
MALRRIAAPLVGALILLGAWETLVRTRDIKPFILRAPSQIIRYVYRFRSDFFADSLTTGWHALIGLAVALLVAVAIGAAMAASPTVDGMMQPPLMLIQVTPFVLYASSVTIWLGTRSNVPIVFTVALVCLPPFAFAAAGGMRSADTAARDLLSTYNASRWAVLWRLRLPAAVPGLFATARYTLGLALIAAYFAETASNFIGEGLGVVGEVAIANTNGDGVWATAFCMAVLGLIGLAVLGVVERRVLHWHASQRR